MAWQLAANNGERLAFWAASASAHRSHVEAQVSLRDHWEVIS
jgi:hypothetical protein